jgi:hypothetical protein
MNEEEWLNSESIGLMLGWCLRESKDNRKKRLFACSCCRRLWRHLPDIRSRTVIEAAEEFADGLIGQASLTRAWVEATRVTRAALDDRRRGDDSPEAAADCLGSPYDDSVLFDAPQRAVLAASNLQLGPHQNEEAAQVRLLRDIFGNPFRPASFSLDWRTSTAVSLAKAMYDSRDFTAMPILADALQDAGCDNDDILNHCRDANGIHVRGCWVVDLVLGKN